MQGRIRAIDWLRGLSVIFMIECHALIFLDPQFHVSRLWNFVVDINGLVCVSFLFSAGFAGGLVGSRAAKDAAGRRRRAVRTFYRLVQVLAMSAYFHLIWQPIHTNPATWLQVDILLCIAISVLVVWAIVTICRGKNGVALAMLLAAATSVLLFTPWAWRYRGSEVITELLNASTGSMFPLFPWLVFPLLGAAMGVVAAAPERGRRRLATCLVILFVATWAICHSPIGSQQWNSYTTEPGVFWAGNTLERMWKLCAVLLGLLAVDSLSFPLAGLPWTRPFKPLERTLNFFSRHALMAYLVHLSLLYGFMNYQFTKQWHQISTPAQYAWRTLVVLAGTAAVCQLIHLIKRLIEAAVRRLLMSMATTDVLARTPSV